jgi:hypothetical protein
MREERKVVAAWIGMRNLPGIRDVCQPMMNYEGA